MLVQGLAQREDSELHKKLALEHEETPWSTERQLQVHTFNMLLNLDYHFVCANSKDPEKVDPPIFMTLPGERELTNEEREDQRRAAKLAALRKSISG